MKSKSLMYGMAGIMLILVLVQGVSADGYNLVDQWGELGLGNGEFNAPRGIAVDKVGGNIYVNDEGNDRIQKFTSDGTYVTQWPVVVGEGAIAVHPLGDSIFYFDYTANQITRISSTDGSYISGTGLLGPVTISGIAVSPTNNMVYASDSTNNQICRYETDGAIIDCWGSTGSLESQFQGPMGIAIDSSGNVYVADSGNKRVQIFDDDGTFIDSFYVGIDTDYPFGVDVDTSGRIYLIINTPFSSWFDLDVGLYDPDPEFPDLPLGWNLQHTGYPDLSNPIQGIGVDSAGYVYITDTGNNRVLKYEYPTTGSIDLSSSPSGAQIWIDGSDSGSVTRSTLSDLTPGPHPVILKYPGYYDYEFIATVMEGWTLTFPIYQMRKIEPVADFSAAQTSGPAPLNVDFTDLSTETPTGWAWFFGDEDYSAAWTRMDTVPPGWSPRYDHTAVAWYDGTIFLTSGYTDSFRRDVWWSVDNGATWVQDIPGQVGGYTGRHGHTSVAMPDGSIVVMGGLSSTGNKNDVWISTDGGHVWSAQTVNAGWTPRSGHTSVALPDGDIVLMGGYDGNFKNDVWRSTDNGATWTPQTSNAEWSARSDHSSVAMPDGSIVLMGGSGNNNEVWRSEDKGVSWTRMDMVSPGWTPRYGHSSVAMPDSSIVLMGGDDGARRNDVWRSTDSGATWTQVSASPGWAPRSHASTVVMHDGSIVLMGGYSAAGIYYNDVWRLNPVGSSLQGPSHTYSAEGMYDVVLQAYNAGGYSSIRKADLIRVGSRAAAAGRMIDDYFGGDPDLPQNAEKELLVSDNEIGEVTLVTLLDGTTITSPDYLSWLGYVDEDKNANWGHLGRIVFYAEGKDPVASVSDMPPVGIAMSHAAGNFANPVGWTSINDPPVQDPICPNPVATNNYALLISGGGTKETNYARYYNDIKFLYRSLVNDYKYDKTHIKVLMSDGLDDAADQFDKYNTDGSKHYINSEQNLDGVSGDDVNGAADYANISKVLTAWQGLSSSSTLLIFTTGHGEKVSTTQANLLLWQSPPYSASEKISDSSFASLLPPNAKITMIMEQCYGGGFNDNVIVSGKVRSLAVAATGSQSSHSNDFSYPWISGVSWHDSASPPNEAIADYPPASGDGLVQMSEAFNYALAHDPSSTAGTETPTFSYTGTGSNTLTPVTCGSTTKSITNILKTPTPWVAGSAGTVTWKSTGLISSNYVILEIMKGAGQGVRQATFVASKSPTLLTASATVPKVMPAGGVDTDYWLKISTISLRPEVIGTSSNFQITGVTAGSPATLPINSNVNPSLITIIDPQGQEVQPGHFTPYTFTLPMGTYYVKVSRSCTIPMNFQMITLGSGEVKSQVTYPLTAVSASDCLNDITTFGSIDITSQPDVGYEVYIKPFGESDDQYIDKGTRTPTIENVPPGEWTVKLEADGFVSGELTVSVNAGDTVNADFVLTPLIEGWVIKDIIVPIEPVPVGTEVQVSSMFTYLGEDYPLTATWTWGDGTTTTEDEVVTDSVTNAHKYLAPGIYTVSLFITDSAITPLTATKDATSYIVVYDPAGGSGFVTGGGWINSPEGAYADNPALTGKATFGFVSKYLKGAKVPTGNTEFQFKVADLNFHSNVYEWLVVNKEGTRAQYKGAGTINGTGEYKFMLWANDGAPDTFRIKIWTESDGTETVVYDNGVEQAIGGGSIVVRNK